MKAGKEKTFSLSSVRSYLKDSALIEDLNNKESLVHSILNKSPHFVAVFDIEVSKFLLVNESGSKMFECKDESYFKKLTPELLFADRPSAEIIYNWKQRIKINGYHRQVARFVTLKEKEFWGLYEVSMIEHGGKRYELHCIADVTQMKNAELIAEREKNKFSTLFENSTIGILVTDSEGKIEIINHFAEKQFGYDSGELIGKKIEILIPHDMAEKHVLHRKNFVKNPHTRPMGIGMNLFGRRKNNTTFPVEVSLSHYTSFEGTQIIAFINDITIRKKNEDAIIIQQNVLQKYAAEVRALNQGLEQRVEERTLALREAMQQLESSREELSAALKKEKELSDLKSRFVSMASHEFRTPLSTILSSATLIEKYEKETDAEKRNRHIDRIKENVKHLNNILEDFLSLGKLDESLISTKKDRIDVPAFFNDIITDMNEVRKGTQKINYSHKGSNEFCTDKYILKNIIINLISNAIKFSPDDGVVEIKSNIDSKHLHFSVQDNGIGISEDDQKHLFGRFFRGKNALNIHGTGLGLHLISKYLELIQGNISCKSQIEKGTEFTITVKNNDTGTATNHE